MCVENPFKYLEGFVEEVGRAVQRHLELLHGFLPATFFLECLEASVLFVQNGLLCIEDQMVNRTHADLRDVSRRTVTVTNSHGKPQAADRLAKAIVCYFVIYH